MEIIQDKTNDIVILQLKGRLDTLSSRTLGETIDQLISQKEHHLIIDLSELIFISSSGLRILLSTAKRMSQLKGKLALSGLQKKVKEVFDVAGFSMLFKLFPSAEDALSQIGK